MDTLKSVSKNSTSIQAKVSDSNAIHTFTQDEVNVYSEHINYFLGVN